MTNGVRTEKAALTVARMIIADVFESRLGPGNSLPPERVMLERYGTGRGTLREALRLLEFQGVVTLRPGPGGGPVLLRPSGAHLASSLVLLMQLNNAPFGAVIDARLTFEPLICRTAAAHRAGRRSGEASRDRKGDG